MIFTVAEIYALMNAAYSVAAKTTDKKQKNFWISLAKQLDRIADEAEKKKGSVEFDIE